MSQPSDQHFKNPLKQGWYYVDRGDGPITGLMSKKAARQWIKDQQKGNGGMYGYGMMIHRHDDTPDSWLAKRFTRP